MNTERTDHRNHLEIKLKRKMKTLRSRQTPSIDILKKSLCTYLNTVVSIIGIAPFLHFFFFVMFNHINKIM